MDRLINISYFPGCPLDVQELNEKSLEEVLAMADASDGFIGGVAWFIDNGEPVACLLVRDAIQKAAHIKAWCGGDMTRFTFVHASGPNGYAFMLCPDLNKSVARVLETQFDNQSIDSSTCIFKPLSFVSDSSSLENYEKIVPLLKTSIKIYLAEIGAMDPQNVVKHLLGSIPVSGADIKAWCGDDMTRFTFGRINGPNGYAFMPCPDEKVAYLIGLLDKKN